MKKLLVFLCSFLLVFGVAVQAHALVTVYYDETAFLSALEPGYYHEDFNSYPLGTLIPPIIGNGTYFVEFPISTVSGEEGVGDFAAVTESPLFSGMEISFGPSLSPVTAFGGYFAGWFDLILGPPPGAGGPVDILLDGNLLVHVPPIPDLSGS